MCLLAVLGSKGIVVRCTAAIFFRTVVWFPCSHLRQGEKTIVSYQNPRFLLICAVDTQTIIVDFQTAPLRVASFKISVFGAFRPPNG